MRSCTVESCHRGDKALGCGSNRPLTLSRATGKMSVCLRGVGNIRACMNCVCLYVILCVCAPLTDGQETLIGLLALSVFFVSGSESSSSYSYTRPNMHALPNSLTRTGIYTCMHADPFLQTHMHRRTHIGVHTYTGTHRDRDNGMD